MSEPQGNPHVGDWIRWQRANRLIIAEVLYVRPRSSWERSDTAITDRGEVQVHQILESRSRVRP